MTALPLPVGRPARVTLTGDAVDIDLRVDHPEVVAAVRAEVGAHGSAGLPGMVTAALVAGMVAVRLARTHQDTVSSVQQTLDGLAAQIEAKATHTVEQLDQLLARVGDADSSAAQAITGVLAQLPDRIEHALAGEAATVRDAVREAASRVQHDGLLQLQGLVRGHSQALRAELSLQSADSPVAALRRDLTAAVEASRRELADGLAEVRALLYAASAVNAAGLKDSNRRGTGWEREVALQVAAWAKATGDVAESVGSRPAPGSASRRTGDVLVSLMTGTRPRMIVEAKNRSKRPSVAEARRELAEARRLRDAAAAVMVVATPDQVPGESRFVRCDRTSWVVAGDDVDLLWLVLSVARENLVLQTAPDGATGVDLARAQTAVGHCTDLLSRFDDIGKHLGGAEGDLAHLRKAADGLRAALLAQLTAAGRALQPQLTSS